MPKIEYISKNFSADKLKRINQANEIIAEYEKQQMSLTLRQLYYQFVARALIPNNPKEYIKLQGIVADAREAGLLDWNAIVDRTRFLRKNSHWDSPHQIVEICSRQFAIDKWDNQPNYLEVWIEKDALIGVIDRVCEENDVPYLACRGYASASEVWDAGYRRIANRIEEGKDCTILYLGDHDPSGLDMTRDVQERLCRYAMSDAVNVERLALNMDQVDEYTPPPNPTKMTDPRGQWYLDKFGEECWELDALNPTTIRDMIETSILAYRDDDAWVESIGIENEHKESLAKIASHWELVMVALKDQ